MTQLNAIPFIVTLAFAIRGINRRRFVGADRVEADRLGGGERRLAAIGARSVAPVTGLPAVSHRAAMPGARPATGTAGTAPARVAITPPAITTAGQPSRRTVTGLRAAATMAAPTEARMSIRRPSSTAITGASAAGPAVAGALQLVSPPERSPALPSPAQVGRDRAQDLGASRGRTRLRKGPDLRARHLPYRGQGERGRGGQTP